MEEIERSNIDNYIDDECGKCNGKLIHRIIRYRLGKVCLKCGIIYYKEGELEWIKMG